MNKLLFGIVAGSLGLTALSHADGVTQINLVSDGSIPAAVTDPNLVNAWGLDFSPTSPLWVNDNGTGLSTLYTNDGAIVPLVVTVPPVGSAPTGIVFNGGTNFVVSNGTTSAPARFIFVTEDGTISGWAPSVNLTAAINMVDNVIPTSVYKGVTIGTDAGGNQFLYAANFHEGMVDMFDSSYHYLKSFTDSSLSSDYTPFNVKAVGQYLVVAYAQADADRFDEVAGQGRGYVDLFALDGTLVKRLINRGQLNAPWGIAIAPQGWAGTRGQLLIGNFGDGTINSYDMDGHFRGSLTTRNGKPVVIDGLWGLAFRDVLDPSTGATTTTLFFTAGPGDEEHGLLGKLVPNG